MQVPAFESRRTFSTQHLARVLSGDEDLIAGYVRLDLEIMFYRLDLCSARIDTCAALEAMTLRV